MQSQTDSSVPIKDHLSHGLSTVPFLYVCSEDLLYNNLC